MEKEQDRIATEKPPMMSAAEAADFFGVSRTTLYRWLRNGKVPALRVEGTGKILVSAEAIAMQLQNYVPTPKPRRSRDKGIRDAVAAFLSEKGLRPPGRAEEAVLTFAISSDKNLTGRKAKEALEAWWAGNPPGPAVPVSAWLLAAIRFRPGR